MFSGGAMRRWRIPCFEGFDDQALNAPRYDEAVFIRIGVSESELAGGYPSDVSEFFRYHVVIWGDIERDFFSLAQLNLTREFVSKRGGSFFDAGRSARILRGRVGAFDY